METNTTTQALPIDIGTDRARHGIQVEELTMECIEINGDLDSPQEEISPDGCEVIELQTEVIIFDYPVHTNWCEVVPRRSNRTQKRPMEMKEVEDVRIAC